VAEADPPIWMLRPALELAWAVAKVGSQARPPVPPPGRLRPIMKVSRLPDRMLTTVREVLDEDEGFRERVVKAAQEELLGRPAWLWLVRPEGWEAELEGVVVEALRSEEEVEEKRASRAAQRQLEEANAALQKLRAELVSVQALNSQLEVELSAARKSRREAEEAAAKVRLALAEALSRQDDLRGTAAGLADRIKRLEAEGTAANERVSASEIERDEALRQLDVLNLALAEARRQVATAQAEAEALRRSLEDVFGAARQAVIEAGIEAGSERDIRSPIDSSPAPPASGSEARQAPGAPGYLVPKRVPARLPPAIFEESPEAARHLVRLPGAFLVVDGYNVTLSSWPGVELPMQRRRLVDSLAELSMRAGTEVLVIFDGIDEGNRLQLPSSVRGRMRVRFTASEVEADEAIIDLMDSLPPQRAVVVATDDRRVRDSVARKGANVITVDQLLAVIGRGPSLPG
jgi:predicted RNA-binding protein with PIN domain